MDRGKPAWIVIAGDEAAGIAHLGRETQGLAAAARAEVDDGLAGSRAAEQARKLRSLVLDLVPAVDEFGLHVQGGAAPVLAEGNPQAVRRMRRGNRRQMSEAGLRVRPAALQGVHADIEGRAPGQSPQFVTGCLTERGFQRRQHPFGHVSDDVKGGIVERAYRQALLLDRGQGLGREALAREHLRDGGRGASVLEPQHPDDEAARALVPHDPGGRGTAAKCIVDEARDGGAVAGPGEAMREAPILQGVGGGAAARSNVGENLDGGGKSGGGGQGEILGMAVGAAIRSRFGR